MARIGKRRAAQIELLGDRSALPLVEALHLVKQTATAKFDESIDMSLNLGIDSRKSDQVVRGATVLPNGAGKTVRIAVFAQGDAADKATLAGADEVGMEDLAEKIKGGDLGFDVVIAAPDAMRVVGALGQVLGPRGLMPNPKVGTVTPDVAGAVENAKKGQVRFRVDKAGIIHCAVGKASFSADALSENIQAVVAEVQKLKPAAAKGVYLDRLTVSSTMGLGVPVDVSTI
ncbi:MAG: 50S ribosomal protein L1 [Gammaproteobacteria bacterium]|nr:MAG: 50S ribosomal protein L1 [Gammaproteobacteria bacterium]RLA13994.1 MAG: 50S ribosomal protein L1 [Gammaproteobacteria bacterium]